MLKRSNAAHLSNDLRPSSFNELHRVTSLPADSNMEQKDKLWGCFWCSWQGVNSRSTDGQFLHPWGIKHHGHVVPLHVWQAVNPGRTFSLTLMMQHGGHGPTWRHMCWDEELRCHNNHRPPQREKATTRCSDSPPHLLPISWIHNIKLLWMKKRR